MQEWINIVIGFVVGGGLMKLLTLRQERQSLKIDYEQKLIEFWQDNAGKLIDKVNGLEDTVKELQNISCKVTNCEKRKKA